MGVTDVLPLAMDQYGNYIVQGVMEHGTDQDRTKILDQLEGHHVALSMEKFASNAVEASLIHGSASQRAKIISEILDGAHLDASTAVADEVKELDLSVADGLVAPLVAIMLHRYGNYVVQRAVEYGSDTQREYIVETVKALQGSLSNCKYGKHILASLSSVTGPT